jgi:flagellar biosynthetic protein FlhB
MAEEQDKSEKASPFKLRKAREQGMVPRSLDFNSFVVLLTFAVVLSLWGRAMAHHFVAMGRNMVLGGPNLHLTSSSWNGWISQLFLNSLAACAPVFGLLFLAALVAGVLQTGFVFSTTPLKPDFKRLNPAEGVKRLFNFKALVETLKTLIKLGILSATVYFFLRSEQLRIYGLTQSDVVRVLPLLIDLVGNLVKWCALALLPIVLIDIVYVRRDYLKKLMMSKREVKEEYKQREGDPRIRSKIRELQMEARRRSGALRKVKDADVLITNPTRLAIAVLYERDKMHAPMVTAKGAGHLAKLMKAMARRHGVPVVENRPLARGLFGKSDIGMPIAESFYPMVAKILTWVYAQRDRRPTAGALA